jgi:hypothetical protein
MVRARVHQVVGWVGGSGTPPAIGKYIGPLGLVTAIADGTDIRGATGAPGVGGGGTGSSLMLEVLTAGEALGGHRVVYLSAADTVRLADSTNTARVGLIVGITTGAVVLGDPAEVQIAGLMTEPTFAFTPGPVYFTSTGVLTQTVPTTGFIQQVATAISATEIVVQLGMPIVLQ